MAGRSPARFLAPIALLAFVFALYTIVHNGSDKGGSNGAAAPSVTATSTSHKTSKKSAKKKTTKKTYVVKSGDTLSGIAEKTGIDAAKLTRLNPKLNPSTLAPGQKIKLR
jgi:LysM repeat protein